MNIPSLIPSFGLFVLAGGCGRYDQGVELEDIDNEHACPGSGGGGGGHPFRGGGMGGMGGMGGIDQEMLFHMFMQQQHAQGRR